MDKEKNNKKDKKSNIESGKNKKRRTRKKGRIIVSLIIVALVAAGAFFYAVPAILGVNWNDMFEYYGAFIAKPEAENDHCLFSVIGGDIKDFNMISGAGIVSTPNSTLVIGKNGGIVSAVNNGYSSAVIKSSGEKNFIAFERSTGKYSIMNKKQKIYSSQLDGEIVNAALSSGGNYVIISKKTLSTSLLTVYSSKNEILFRWECNNGYLTDCAISPNGKNIAVAAFDVENGDKATKILTFTTKSLEVEKEIETGNAIVCGMKFLTNDSLGYVTDENYFIADVNSAEVKSVSYEYDTLSGWFFAENNSVTIVRNAFGSLDDSTICVIDRNADEIMKSEFSGRIIDFCTDKSYVYVLCADKITVLAVSSGETVSEIETAGGLRHIAVVSGKIFCSSDSEVYSYSR